MIENKPGGQNTIGAQAAARSPADGFTFYFATTAALVTNPLLFKTLPYDPAKDFVPVAFIARSPFALLVRGESPITSIDDLIARSKAEPGKLTLGNEGPRTFSGMIARLLNARTQAQANLVPYASVGVGTQDLMGGHVDAMVADLASTAALARQGKLRVLATTSARRVAGLGQRARAGREAARLRHGRLVRRRRARGHAGRGHRAQQPRHQRTAGRQGGGRAHRHHRPGRRWQHERGAGRRVPQGESVRWAEIVKEIGVLPE